MKKRGIILEIREKDVIVVDDTCEYIKIKRVDGMFEGQMVEYNSPKNNKIIRYSAVVASAAALFIFAFVGYFILTQNIKPQVYAYVDLDINPSVEFIIDQHNVVIGMRTLSSEGEEIIKSAKVEGMNINEAVSDILLKLKENGYVKSESQNLVLLSASYSNKTELTKNDSNKDFVELNKTIDNIKGTIESNERMNISVEVICVAQDIRQPSLEHNMSMGRYALYSKAVQKGANITPQDAKNAPLDELILYLSDEQSCSSAETITDNDSSKINKSEDKVQASSQVHLHTSKQTSIEVPVPTMTLTPTQAVIPTPTQTPTPAHTPANTPTSFKAPKQEVVSESPGVPSMTGEKNDYRAKPGRVQTPSPQVTPQYSETPEKESGGIIAEPVKPPVMELPRDPKESERPLIGEPKRYPGDGPLRFPGGEPEGEPERPTGEEPERFPRVEPERPSIEEPPKFPKADPERPSVSAPIRLPRGEPERPLGEGPEKFPGGEPRTFPR